MMRVTLNYDSESGHVMTDVEVGKGYNTDALDDMRARASKVHQEIMAKAATLWLASPDLVEPVVTEVVKP